jgi:hypothetical protein
MVNFLWFKHSHDLKKQSSCIACFSLSIYTSTACTVIDCFDFEINRLIKILTLNTIRKATTKEPNTSKGK